MPEQPSKQPSDQSIDDIVKKALQEMQVRMMPFGLIIASPSGYAAGITNKYSIPKNRTPDNYELIVSHMFFAFLDVMIEYVPPKNLKKWVNVLYDKFEMDNYEKFLGIDNDDKPK
ncbi:MAG: hypothetical protein Q8O88_00920 [bacterium]|nr:hypothetical protein [bacterium]